MAMVFVLPPVLGVPVPLISFRGTAQMTALLCIGILMSIDRANRRQVRF